MVLYLGSKEEGDFLEGTLDEGFLRISFDDINTARTLFGPREENIKYLRKHFNIRASVRGNNLTITGDKKDVEKTNMVIRELQERIKKGHSVAPDDIDQVIFAITNKKQEVSFGQILIPPTRKIITPRSKNQEEYIEAIKKHDIVVAIGPAGTGKTYLAMAMALNFYYTREVSRIVLTRPAIEAGEKLGFLPGSMYEKVNPYLRPLYDALYDMVEFDKASKLIERGVIEIAPLAFMRGRTLNDAFIILDEAQNTLSDQMKMFLTRLGFSSKTVITGDVTQIDLSDKRLSGLVEIQKILKGIRGIKFVYFSERDVVRHPLVKKIIKAYETKKVKQEHEHSERKR